ncbi:hypothetical protein ACFE04_005044 [Oxalis oulophora]
MSTNSTNAASHHQQPRKGLEVIKKTTHLIRWSDRVGGPLPPNSDKPLVQKVNIIYEDPDATDSSSDEEINRGPTRRVKRFVHQTVITHPVAEPVISPPTPPVVAKNSDEGSTSEKLKNVRLRQWGWSSEIRHGKKFRVWLGTYKTKIKAAAAYDEAAACLRPGHEIRYPGVLMQEEIDFIKAKVIKAMGVSSSGGNSSGAPSSARGSVAVVDDATATAAAALVEMMNSGSNWRASGSVAVVDDATATAADALVEMLNSGSKVEGKAKKRGRKSLGN